MSTSEGELELKKRLMSCPDCTNDGYACGKQHFLEGKCRTQFVCAFQEKPPTSEGLRRTVGYVEILDRLWVLVKNMNGLDLCWEWMEDGGSETSYLDRGMVLKLIDDLKKEIST